MTAWRAAHSLTTLLAQVNKAHPGRSKKSDGVIGDKAHAATASDHNPVAGVVHALDLTNDPAKGLDRANAGEDGSTQGQGDAEASENATT